MTTAKMKDGSEIYFKDWGSGPVVTFSHGCPLTADAWDAQMLYFGNHGHRVIAHDRRGHGRSGQTWTGNDMDTYADDLATLLQSLDVTSATMVGHSTGGGEVARYIGLFRALEFVADRAHRTPFEAASAIADRVKQAGLDRGLAIYPCTGTVDGTLGDHIIVAQPYIVSDSDLAEIVDRLGEAVDAVFA